MEGAARPAATPRTMPMVIRMGRLIRDFMKRPPEIRTVAEERRDECREGVRPSASLYGVRFTRFVFDKIEKTARQTSVP